MQMLLITMSALIFLSCGEQGLKPGSEGATSGSELHEASLDPISKSTDDYATTVLLQSEDNLPACSENVQGQLAFIIQTDNLKTCDSGTWVDISIGAQATDEFSQTGF